MSADPYCDEATFLADLRNLFDDPTIGDVCPAELCSDEAYGDQWDRMDAYLAERLPWPRTPLAWDTDPEMAQMLAPVLYDGTYGWGVLVCRGGPAAQRIISATRQKRLLDAIFSPPPHRPTHRHRTNGPNHDRHA